MRRALANGEKSSSILCIHLICMTVLSADYVPAIVLGAGYVKVSREDPPQKAVYYVADILVERDVQ